MIKIGVYCQDPTHKKEIVNLLKQYFEDLKMEVNLISLRAKVTVLKNITKSFDDYNFVLFCEDDKIIYYKKNLMDHYKNLSNITIGWLNMPLSIDKIDGIILNNEDYHDCPRGIYMLENSKTIRPLLYGDISFCRWNGHKSMIYLKGDETEEVNKSIKKLKKEMPEIYFAESGKGYIINLYNVNKIDKTKHQFVMCTGQRIPISSKKFNSMVSLYIHVMFGI